VWRDYGSIGYLRRWRDQTPQALAVSAFGLSRRDRSWTVDRCV